MKLSPTVSNWIRRFILKQGAVKSALVITILSVLLSVLIAKLVSSLMPGGSGNFSLVLAIIVPALIAPPFGYIFMNLYIELEKVREEVHALAITDELTRTFNRRHFMNLAAQELGRVKRYQHPLSILIFDIDNFKNVNDNYGHLCGDAVLREISSTCRTILRQCDVLARFGGEEFILLLPETNEANALKVANRLCQLIAIHVVEYKEAQIRVTISAGVTTFKPTTDTLDDLLNRADQALYLAKRLGKNRLEVA
jgi:diguanylate cyclase (GGDEF)-like protein